MPPQWSQSSKESVPVGVTAGRELTLEKQGLFLDLCCP